LIFNKQNKNTLSNKVLDKRTFFSYIIDIKENQKGVTNEKIYF